MLNYTNYDIYDHLVLMGKVESLGYVGNLICAVYLTIIGIFSVMGNGVVMLVMMKSRKMRIKPHNILLVNMATADILVSVVGYPFTTISAYCGRYIFGNLVCKVQGFLTFLLTMVAMTTLVFLSLYRFIAVCLPWLKYRITGSVTKKCLAVIWLYSAFWTSMPLFGWNNYTLETFGTSCSVDWTSSEDSSMLYVHCLIVFCYLLPVAIMSFCYYRIVLRATKLHTFRGKILSIYEAACHHTLRTEVKLSGMCFTMVFFFTVVWSPYTIVSLWSLYDRVPVWATALPTMFAKLASALNPYIYVITNPDFRRSVRMLITDCFRSRSRVAPAPQRGRTGVKDNGGSVYTVDRTKEGVFIGQQTVVVRDRADTFF